MIPVILSVDLMDDPSTMASIAISCLWDLYLFIEISPQMYNIYLKDLVEAPRIEPEQSGVNPNYKRPASPPLFYRGNKLTHQLYFPFFY